MRLIEPDRLADSLEMVLSRRECIIAFGTGEIRGRAAAALLHADWAAITEDASIVLDSAEAWSGAIWRIGRGALRLLVDGGTRDLADAIVPAGTNPLQWLEAWMNGRSELALDSAAGLIRRRGGDPLERAEFARIFATGEPQRGLAAFLAKRNAQWRKNAER